MSTNDRGSFLRSDTKSWVSSNLFFHCIEKLGLNEKIYYIPTGITCSNEELRYYVEHLFDELGDLELSYDDREKEAKNYIMKIGFILRAWAREGYGLKVV